MTRVLAMIAGLLMGVLALGSPSLAGSATGPTRTAEQVKGNGTDVYNMTFVAGKPAVIEVRGDGDTDLDLYVFDSSGILIGKDDDLTDHCLVRFQPRWTGKFQIKIVNRGSLVNNYLVTTN